MVLVKPADVSDAKRRLAEILKRRGTATVAELATDLAVTPAAVRQHLADLESHGLVRSERGNGHGPGRPPGLWELTPLASSFFPDRHADLTVELIGAMRRALGDEGLQRVIDRRSEEQVRSYRAGMGAGAASVDDRVEALARRRTAEGYMAEARADDDGTWLLVENHCPVCEAATACTGLCRAELEVFQRVLGDDVSIERERHLLAGDQRCTYRIRRR